MDLFDRVFRLHQILRQARYPVPRAVVQEKLECSRATVTRVIGEMRDYLGAPIEYDRRGNGYRYAHRPDGPYELPGLWFNASELHALLAIHQLLTRLQPGLLDGELAPLRARIERLLDSRHAGGAEIGKRVRILQMAARRLAPEHFQRVAGALLQRRRLRITYHGRERDVRTERIVSPQRLVHYRDNWYLDAWDHGKRALRTFALDRMLAAQALEAPARDIAEGRLDAHFASAYGIFAGRPKHKAVLRFSPERARWVAEERWHPQQKGRFENGHYFLEIPYSDDRELVLDILKHGAEVEVLEPESLRKKVLDELLRAAAQYRR